MIDEANTTLKFSPHPGINVRRANDEIEAFSFTLPLLFYRAATQNLYFYCFLKLKLLAMNLLNHATGAKLVTEFHTTSH